MPAHHAPTRHHLGLAASMVGLAVTIAACGGGSTSSAQSSTSSASSSSSGMAVMSYPPVTPGTTATGPHNDTDVMFANDMIPHHGQAVQMADMILARTSTPDVKALAERIKAAQTPEIAAMTGWLVGWGQQPPNPYEHTAGMAGMQHSGMMSQEQMAELDKATGTAADKVFLTSMQEHHQGAIDISKTELAQGANPDAKKLAQSISTSQTAEIAEMKAMLAKIG